MSASEVAPLLDASPGDDICDVVATEETGGEAARGAPAPPARSPRKRRASALRAAATVARWRTEEELPLSAIAGKDLRINEKVRREIASARQRRGSTSVGAGTGPASAPPRSESDPSSESEGGSDADVLRGCSKCRYSVNGCGSCRTRPAFVRRRLRWRPEAGRAQAAPDAPVYEPTEIEWADPMAYVERIIARPEALAAGIVRILPPPSFLPPFALEQGTNGLSAESFRFRVRSQRTSALCLRGSTKRSSGGGRYATRDPAAGGSNADGRDSKVQEGADLGTAGSTPPASELPGLGASLAPATTEDSLEAEPKPKAYPLAEEAAVTPWPSSGPERGSGPDGVPASASDPSDLGSDATDSESDASDSSTDSGFGFISLERTHTLKSFAAYSDWLLGVHFSDPRPAGNGGDARGAKRPKGLRAGRGAVTPSLEELEGEFWRIVEAPDERVESLYGQDLDSGHHGSGFPLPPWRRELLAAYLKETSKKEVEVPEAVTPVDRLYAAHPWNVNNMPKARGSVLRHMMSESPELITGVMIPWLYVGSALSAFCWHLEDHGLCSVNYNHLGAPKVWYGIPASAAEAFEEAVRDALPHLMADCPDLLHQLVTMVGPTTLAARGVQVVRAVQHAGEFVITLPNAYHGGFNAGFNVAEAVNFGPPSWLPYGSASARKYRAEKRHCTFSHDALLCCIVKQAIEALEHERGGVPSPAGPASPSRPSRDRRAPALPVPPGGADAVPPVEAAARLGGGELAARAREEARRLGSFLGALADEPYRLVQCAARARPGSRDSAGRLADPAEVECSHCHADLWLSAAVVEGVEGAACPDHVGHLLEKRGDGRGEVSLLQRHTPEALEAMASKLSELLPGTHEAVTKAIETLQLEQAGEAPCLHATPVGPLYDPALLGQDGLLRPRGGAGAKEQVGPAEADHGGSAPPSAAVDSPSSARPAADGATLHTDNPGGSAPADGRCAVVAQAPSEVAAPSTSASSGNRPILICPIPSSELAPASSGSPSSRAEPSAGRRTEPPPPNKLTGEESGDLSYGSVPVVAV